MNQEQAVKAIKEGCNKAKCYLVSHRFEDSNVYIVVGDNTDRAHQIGMECEWQSKTVNELTLRTRRFAQHYVKRIPYRSDNPFGSIE